MPTTRSSVRAAQVGPDSPGFPIDAVAVTWDEEPGSHGDGHAEEFGAVRFPTAASRQALVDVLAHLAGRHGLPVATECPGGSIEADLPTLRDDVAAAMAGTVRLSWKNVRSGTWTVTVTDVADADRDGTTTSASLTKEPGAGNSVGRAAMARPTCVT